MMHFPSNIYFFISSTNSVWTQCWERTDCLNVTTGQRAVTSLEHGVYNKINEHITHISKLIKPPEEFVQQPNQLLSGALGRQNGESNNIGEQNTETHIENN